MDTYTQIFQKVVDMVVVEIVVKVHQPQVMQAHLALALAVVEVDKLKQQVEQVELVSLLLDTWSK